MMPPFIRASMHSGSEPVMQNEMFPADKRDFIRY